MSNEHPRPDSATIEQLTRAVVESTPAAPLRRRARRYAEATVLAKTAPFYAETGTLSMTELHGVELDAGQRGLGVGGALRAGLRVVGFDAGRYSDADAHLTGQKLSRDDETLRAGLQAVLRALEARDAAAGRELALALVAYAPEEPRAWGALARVHRALGDNEASDLAETRGVELMAAEIEAADPPLSLRERMRRFSLVTFLGGPATQYVEMGLMQLNAMLEQGLEPHHKVLDIGCGPMRAGLWLLKVLEPDRYFGIEPHKARLRFGIDHVLGSELVERKRPRFDHNMDFDLGVFGEKFDFMVARSVWTHACKRQILAMLDGFVEHAAPGGVFMTSFIPARSPEEDFQGDDWVGESHDSPFAGLVGHLPSWVEQVCGERGLKVCALQDHVANRQIWLRIERA